MAISPLEATVTVCPKGWKAVHLLTSCLLCGELQEEKKVILLQGTLAKSKGRQGQDGVS